MQNRRFGLDFMTVISTARVSRNIHAVHTEIEEL